MHLKSITLKGFKSFPDRTKLDFGPGVSVIVGPNGSGKSNVTDAVLWAMGEQSPLAVRGQSMQDVIFGGGRGQASRQAAEVEIVIDNGDGGLPVGFSEIAIVRKLDRTGEGEYRLNGARCRLVDVIEMLSDTGLGKEGHSIVSQGRVEAVVTSKPKDRRLLIEEAAGLGKHRKRRRRAQLKLERTQENLDRALDVEREARSRLRPLKRQAEAAELHARLERQTSEARWSLAREAVRARRAELAEAERAATAAHEAQAAVEAELQTVAAAREAAEEALAGRSEAREALSQRAYRARGAADRVAMRLEGVRGVQATITRRAEVLGAEVDRLEGAVGMDAESGDEGAGERIAALEAELERLEAERAASLEREVASLEEQRVAAGAAVQEADTELASRRAAVAAADAVAERARATRTEAERAVEAARREAATVGVAGASRHLAEKCVDAEKHLSGKKVFGVLAIEADEARCRDLIELSLAMCTSLAPRIGYDVAAALAKKAYQGGVNVRQVALEVLPGKSVDGGYRGARSVRPPALLDRLGVPTAAEVEAMLEPHGQTIRGTGVGGSGGG